MYLKRFEGHLRYRLPSAVNPIVVKELRSRMRGARAFAILTAALLLLGAVSYALYRILLMTSRYSYSPLSPQIGQTLFVALALLELMMVCFITPAVTAGAISGEREKLTYEMLLATPLRPASILWGKLVSALSYIFLLIFAAVPMASLVFIFGGVSPRDMVKALVVLVAVAVLLGVVGVFASAWVGRTARATVVSYLVVLGLLIGPVFLYILVGVLRQSEPPRWILVPNPVSALLSALSPSMPSDSLGGVFWGLGMSLGGNLGVLTGQGLQAGMPRPLYHCTLPLYATMTLALYLLATRLVRPTRRWRVGLKEALTAVVLFLALGCAVALAFLSTADRYEKVSGVFTSTPFPQPVVPVPVVVERVVPVELEKPPPPTPVPTEPPAVASPLPTPALTLSEEDQVAIYAAVLRQPPQFPIVYLVQQTDDMAGHPSAPQAPSRMLPEAVQAAIVAALTDLTTEFRWVKDPSQVPLVEDTGEVEGSGAIVTLGNVHPQQDGSALVSVRLDFSNLARGKTYIVGRVEDGWQVIGDTRATWTSY